ncbi:hypothetical protein EDB81DRAFT_724228 [Dactylonectria macrodidyma]|uniref:Uncharacterized protein n=1 Tax=Dactylonectria macrodidyma TaxID=307937 RepID=A0A9P9IYW8_9HYPO|nr:hypothetical protein EDB81DRAFT_724228 [Dactylonectria macrodidyma]
MALRSVSGKIIASSVVAALTVGGTYAFFVHRRIKATDPKKITTSTNIPESLQKSRAVTEIVNAKKHPQMEDSRFITIEIPPEHQDATDEVLLARFAKGFFGGLVIAPERIFLWTFRPRFLNFSKIKTSESTPQIWEVSQLSDNQLPPLYSELFGVFQVIDAQIDPKSHLKDQQGRTESYIDFGFCSDLSRFAGVHRFSVVRSNGESPSQQAVQIHLQSMTCNPMVNKPLAMQSMFKFHLAYAELLFREGVSQVTAPFREV